MVASSLWTVRLSWLENADPRSLFSAGDVDL